MALRAAETDEDALSDERGINNLGCVFNGVYMALRAAESDEDVWSPAPDRDRQGVNMALRAAETDESQSAMR
jgi:hypothetical protein